MAGSDLPRILLVDDEQDLLDGLRRQLRREFDVETAVGAANGLFSLGKGAPFEVIVSDFMMPGINGAQFLTAARKAAPSATRMLLTGHTNLADAAITVNQGGIFRMLLKPVDHETMTGALRDCVAQHRLVVAERELLEQTLRGSVQALTEVLSLVSPAAFGRGTRMRRVAAAILDAVGAEDRWALELAVQMSQLGAVSLPPAVAERLMTGVDLNATEQAMVDRMGEVAEQLVSPIPRLGAVAEAIRYSRKGFDGSGAPPDGTAGDRIPFGGRLLRLVEDHDALLAQGASPTVAIATLRSQAARYDPVLLDALAAVASPAGGVRGVPMAELQVGMVLAAPVTSLSGVLLVSGGQDVTPGLLTRLRNFAELEDGVAEPLMVMDAE
ncbi:HD domain-containing phosphohydrolase [Catenuloplanes atrovinosus]|uniref:Response regulator RpfG family c-di-GMP phosphodiesterase n=1 Tax=Catenuloplanes atrovinosus TaxID=137266 RepID=A0AAE4C9X1_9ACTN|nr:HD domain-containing phosphohydrolase [Catenuloplanes atrovinosus]MDR7275249.1 response regulator RpfG family c-di-GMP phosphodiesterase [Catenuloplanes atrovinosus]